MSRKNSSKGSHPKREKPLSETRLLDRLTPDEADAVLQGLLKRHPELRPEAEELARNRATSSSIEEIVDEVFCAVSSVGLDELNQRAGSHRWGYVEPVEAAWELLEESLEHLIDDMKRQVDVGLTAG